GHGWARNEVFVLETATGKRHDITAGLTAHFAPQFVDGNLWMRTDLDAPRGRVVRVDLANPARDQWKDVIPQGDQVLDGFQVIDSLVWVTWIKDVGHQVTAHTKGGTEVHRLDVRPGTSVTLRGGPKGTVYLTETGFDRPTVTFAVDLATKVRTVHEASKVPFDTGSVDVRQVWYTSRDGTRAPMWVMSRRGAPRQATTPALLNGYGGFVLSLLPRFDARAAAWVERGGIYVQATLRGGNEYGEEWHKGGMLQNKQNVFDDFNAAAQYLVDSGYTSPAHLAIRGGSNGGLLMGAAITQRPELYRAAFVGVPDLDMVRFYTFRTHNNMPALLEYGDASRKEEFDAIIKHSPYQAVRDGAKYPAVFVQTGINDTRVPPWQARRFTARLQAATGSREPVILYHDLRSGHAGGRSNAGGIELATKELEFLWTRTARE
ncbi:MAG: S9 family peptidase, partial [Gemmatimonadetes bacterium]|nr:S9 family peptidase [Gemmatimonadota bacterium]